MTSTNFYDSLNELVLDSRFRNLTVTQNFENFLNSYGINEAENMFTFSWLLSPKGSHGLKDVFFKEFMTNCWSTINGCFGNDFKAFKSLKFFSALSPVYFQSNSFNNAYIDRDITNEIPCADMVITDHASKVMIIVNNRYDQTACTKAYTYFNSEKFNYFENKVFVSFDGEAQAQKDGQWMYMNNEWIINLCTNIIECPQYNNMKITSYLKDFYQFLTGNQYGTNENLIADHCATLISDYYEVLSALKSYKAEKISDKCLVDINPRDYATLYAGKISEKEYGVLSLYWSYRNTFNTFFQNVELESVTHNMEKSVENKGYRFDRKFIRNGFCFTPSFNKVRTDRAFMNTIFDVEMVFDMNKNLTMCLVVNKGSWDKLTTVQRETIQKNFDYSGMILNDRAVVWQNFYRQDWKNKDLGKDVVALFDKVDSYFATLGFKVA